MKKLLLVISAISILFVLASAAAAEEANTVSTAPALIAEICRENGIYATVKEIEQLAGSDKGVVSFKGLKTALSKKGLRSSGLKADSLDQLAEFTQKGYCLVILSKNRIYVRVQSVSNDFVEVHNPSTYPKADSIPRAVFEGEWDGTFLFIERASNSLSFSIADYLGKMRFFGNYIGTAHAAGGVTALTDNQMQAAQGGNPCKNPNGNPGPQPDEETEDPVILTNGNLHSIETDFSIETRGLVPLELTRTYNSQVVSCVEGWQPETASGPWAVRDGVYGGFGDRTFTTRSFMNFTMQADIKTILPGENSWETAWIDFCYKDEENRYYFLIKKDGLLEFTKMKNGQMTQSQKSSRYNPLNWNTIKIIASNASIKIYVNNNLEFNYNDTDPLYENAPIGLEARFSYAQFDNISIQSDAENYSYNFNTPDRAEPFGRGWSFNYGMSVQICANGDARVIKEDGRADLFTPLENLGSSLTGFTKNLNGTYTSPTWLYETLTKDTGGWTLRQKDGTKYAFDAAGRFIYIEDRFKNRNTLYYEGNLLKKVTDPAGRKLTFEYSSDGRITKAIDPKGNKYEYIYDGLNLTEVMDPRNNPKYYEYDPIRNLRTAYIDRNGNRYEYTHSYNARVIEQKDPEGNLTTFEYWWDTTHVINKDNETWYYRFLTDTHTLDDITDNLGTVINYTWDSQNNLTQQDEAYGKTTKYEYDQKGNPVKVTDAEGGQNYLQYDADYSLITRKKDPNGNETSYTYQDGMLTKINEPLDKTVTITYYPYGRPKTIIDSKGNKTEFRSDIYGYPGKITRYTETGYVERNLTYDAAGNLIREQDEEGNITYYTYDANNNLLTVRDKRGDIIVSYTYDKNDNIKSTKDSLGHITLYEYDWAGNLIKKTEYDESNTEHTTEYTYDNKDYLHLGKSYLAEIKDPEENITRYEYIKDSSSGEMRKAIIKTDAEGRATKSQYTKLGYLAYIEDPAGKKTYYSPDYLGRPKTVTYSDGSSEGYAYDAAGRLITKRDRKYQAITYQYDALNRLAKKLYPDSSAIDYTYDKVDNLKTVTDPSGTTTLAYDKLNRLISAKNANNKTVSYEYYRNGLRKKLTYPDNTCITYSYDNLKRLTSINDSNGTPIASYTYDNLSLRRKALTCQNGASIDYSYDALNRIKSLKNKAKGGNIFSQFSYTYDKAGNKLTMTSKEGLHKYYYDKTYQLVDVTYPDQRTGHYEYDAIGNRVYVDDRGESLDYVLKPNGLCQYDAVSKSTHNIDVKGQVTGTSPAVTVNNIKAKVTGADYLAEEVTLKSGINTITATAVNSKATASKSINVTLDTAADKLFTYDNNGSLTKTTFGAKQADYTYDYENRLIKVSSLGGPAHSSALYKYDYLGRRIEKNIGGTVTKYIYDGDNIIAEYNGNGTLIARYVFGPGIDEPIRLERGSTICYYHFDALGSVTDFSNSSGQQAEHYYYDPFGKTKIYNASGAKLADSTYANRYRFTAREWDSESGLYYYRARMYNPALGRFLQKDPVGYSAGDMNLYRYVGNNPTNLIDPLGLEGEDPNGPKRPDETWDEYWERKRRQRDIKRLKNALKRANRLADLGMLGAAAAALSGALSDSIGSGAIASYAWWDITSHLFPGTNYLGWTKSGPGPPMSNLDLYGLIHDTLLGRTGDSALQLTNPDVMTAHIIFVSLWYQDYQSRN